MSSHPYTNQGLISIVIPRSSAAVGTNLVTTSNLKYLLTYMTELKHACHCVYKIRYHVVFCMKTKLQSDGTSCPAALLRLGVPSQRLTQNIIVKGHILKSGGISR